MQIPIQGLNALRGKAIVGAFLGGMTLLSSVPNAQEKTIRKSQSPPLLLVLVRPTTCSLHIVRADANGQVKADLSQGNVLEAEPILSPEGKNAKSITDKESGLMLSNGSGLLLLFFTLAR